MATFNSMPPAMPSGASPNDNIGLNGPMGPGLGIEAFDQDLAFDESILDNVNGGLHGLPFTPTYEFENFSTTFEDPFNYAKPYEIAPDPNNAFHDEGSSPQQLDDKLLGFSATTVKAQPVDDTTGAMSELNLSAELYGMFFVAEDVFGGETTGRPLELTCYRRNLWQCSGQITMPRHCTQVINEQGRAVPITEFYASILAMESIEGKPTEIISIPWKSSNPALGEGQETKTAGPPPKSVLDLTGGQEVDGHRVSLPVSWKRLQFKSATANNGRRKGLQQHYVVQIRLLGKMKASGDLMKIAEIQSGPVIVRGRSPRNFDSRKDVPLSTEKKGGSVERPRTHSDGTIDNGSSSGSNNNSNNDNNNSAAHMNNLKHERSDMSQSLHRYQSIGGAIHTSTTTNDWNATPTPAYTNAQPGNNTSQHPSKKVSISPNLSRPPVPSWTLKDSALSSHSSSGHKTPHKTSFASSSSSKGCGSSTTAAVVSTLGPISLSLSEDERSPNNRSTSDTLQSPRLNRVGTNQSHGSPSEETEQLYEYFPLSIDDWTPLVDTVYRPHIVHHIAVPQEIQAQKVRSKAKRYFSAE
ncbi:p53-like transcription factor [Apiospora aurea]|uniref:P53-like transcription factor n=1 Tax=Apiospora aurea TaxID=335848 RepID=A0ABR1PYH1_9PEZI